MTSTNQGYYHELSLYTLQLQDASFIHQHVVDAFTAQTADEHTKPIALWFALIGLYLAVERSYTGRQVQQMHVAISNKTKHFPLLDLPEKRGSITIQHVLAYSPGEERDNMIKQWCSSVWQAYKSEQVNVREFIAENYQ